MASRFIDEARGNNSGDGHHEPDQALRVCLWIRLFPLSFRHKLAVEFYLRPRRPSNPCPFAFVRKPRSLPRRASTPTPSSSDSRSIYLLANMDNSWSPSGPRCPHHGGGWSGCAGVRDGAGASGMVGRSGNANGGGERADWTIADLHAHEAGNGGQGQGRPTVSAVLFYSEACANASLEN